MASLWKKRNSKNYYYRFVIKGKPYQGTTRKSNKTQAQRTANKIEAETKQSLNWKVAYDRLLLSLLALPVAEQAKIRLSLAQELLESSGNTLPINDAFDKWLKVPKKRSQSEQTIADYRFTWNSFADFLLNNYPDTVNMHEITISIAQAYMNDLWGKNLTERTYNKKLTFIRGIFEKLKKDIGVQDNPFESIPKKQNTTISRAPLSHSQIDQLLITATAEYQTIIYLGAFLGTRLNDAVDMRWENINLNKKEVTYTPFKTESYQREIKVPIFPKLLKHLKSLEKTNAYLTPTLSTLYKTSNASKVSDTITDLIKSIGIKETTKKRKDGRGKAASIYGYHSLRHSFVSTCKNNDIPQHIVKAWVAHSTDAVSAIYTHIDSETSRKFAKKMEENEWV